MGILSNAQSDRGAVQSIHPGLGAGWTALADELRQRLGSLEPQAQLVDVVLDELGLPRFVVRCPAQARAQARTLVRIYESRAVTTCEQCGGAGRIWAGAIVTVACEECVGAHQARA